MRADKTLEPLLPDRREADVARIRHDIVHRQRNEDLAAFRERSVRAAKMTALPK
jgi:hypothetical protein